MRRRAAGAYRPRRPRASPLWQCVTRHATGLQAAGGARRALEAQVIGRFLECGDPHYGFARAYCDACGHDYLLECPKRKGPMRIIAFIDDPLVVRRISSTWGRGSPRRWSAPRRCPLTHGTKP